MSVDKPYRSFWFHYNKPQSQKHKQVIWTVHFGGKCLLVNDIICQVPVSSRSRTRQPFAVMAGRCRDVFVQNKIATVLG